MNEKNPKPFFYVRLRLDQWDLILLVLRKALHLTTTSEVKYAIDDIGRKFLTRNINEIIADIERVTKK